MTAGSASAKTSSARTTAPPRDDLIKNPACCMGAPPLLLDQLLALFEVGIADGTVEVERAFFHRFERFNVLRPIVELVLTGSPDPAPQRNEIVDRARARSKTEPHVR